MRDARLFVSLRREAISRNRRGGSAPGGAGVPAGSVARRCGETRGAREEAAGRRGDRSAHERSGHAMLCGRRRGEWRRAVRRGDGDLDGGRARASAGAIAAGGTRSHRARDRERADADRESSGSLRDRRFGRVASGDGCAARRAGGHRAGANRGSQHRACGARRGARIVRVCLEGNAGFARDELRGGANCGAEIQRIFRVAILERGALVQIGRVQETVAGRVGLDAGDGVSARRGDRAAAAALQDLRGGGEGSE